MPPMPSQRPIPHNHLPAAGPAVEDHGRVVTASPQAAAWYRRAQRAADPYRTAEALRLAVTADPDFALAAADLAAITGAPGRPLGRPADELGTPSHRSSQPLRPQAISPEHLTCSASTSPASAATLSPSGSRPGSEGPWRGMTWRTWSASYPVATPPRGLDPLRAKIEIILYRTVVVRSPGGRGGLRGGVQSRTEVMAQRLASRRGDGGERVAWAGAARGVAVARDCG